MKVKLPHSLRTPEPTRTLVVGDTHFGHDKLSVYEEGWRSLGETRAAQEETLIDRLNTAALKLSNPLIIFMGDVVWNAKGFEQVERIRAKKWLIHGNHDQLPTRTYMEYFEEIRGVICIEPAVFSHYPLHYAALGGESRYRVNVHGHRHSAEIGSGYPLSYQDIRYFNVCLERTEFQPLLLSDLLLQVEERVQYLEECKELGHPPVTETVVKEFL